MLQAINISKYFTGDAVLEGVNLDLRTGERVALVGPNGAGKSTLLRILLGELEADSGQISRIPGLTVAYLPQDAGCTPGRTLYEEMLSLFADVVALEGEQRRLEVEMGRAVSGSAEQMALVEAHAEAHAEFERRGGYTLEAEIGKVLYGLGFSMDDYGKRTEHFSGGWQMRIALARLLLQRPDLLMLDEPTNHLDLRATEWLEGYLRNYRGSVVVVSHDRYFLDLVVSRTVELERAKLTEYQGNYSYYVKEKALRLRQQEGAYQRQQNYLARQQAFIDRFGADKRRSSQTQSREKLLEKMVKIEAPISHQKAIKFRFPNATPSGRKVFDLRTGGKSYDGKWVFQGAELLVEKGDRVALVGPNGSGKSTLLRMLNGLEKPDAGVLSIGANVLRAYYAQDQSDTLDEANNVLKELYTAAPKDWTLEDVRSMLGRFLFTGDDVYKPIEVLSGGERSRLALAKMLLRASNVLLLDEPTNHLDVASREMLESALLDYPGTLVLASHDRYLIDKLATKVVEVEAGHALLYVGNYTNYRDKKAAEQAASESDGQKQKGSLLHSLVTENRRLSKNDVDGDSAPSTQHVAPSRPASPRTSARRIQKELSAVEREIIALEERVAELEQQMADPDLFADHERSRPIVEEHTQLTSRLPELNRLWEELGDQLAAAGNQLSATS